MIKKNETKGSVCIVGSGPSGLTSIKAALSCDLIPTCFEMTSSVGGIWSNESCSMWDSMKTNVTYNNISFSDFPWPENIKLNTDYLKREQVGEYLQSYCDHFNLNDYIDFRSKVVNIVKISNEKWNVRWIQTDKNGKAHENEKIFDFVIVSSGVFVLGDDFNILKGLEGFTGEILHSKYYKNSVPFKDKKVVVIGNSFSGCDITAEVSKVSKKLIQTGRKNAYVFKRYIQIEPNKTKPLDIILYNRSLYYKLNWFPDILNKMVSHFMLSSIPSSHHSKNPLLKVTTRSWRPAFVGISDTYIDAIENNKGEIEIKKCTVKESNGKLITFEDNTTEEIDSVICCHGFKPNLNYLEKELLDEIEYNEHDQLFPVVLHKGTFPKSTKGIAFIGIYKGAYISTMELQARWSTMVFSGILEHPKPQDLEYGVQSEKSERDVSHRTQFSHDLVAINEILAKECKVLPDYNKIKQENPSLFEKLWNGPYTCASFRLTGHDSNEKIALSTINEIYEKYK